MRFAKVFVGEEAGGLSTVVGLELGFRISFPFHFRQLVEEEMEPPMEAFPLPTNKTARILHT